MKTNINAFKKLIQRYETITLEEIKDAFKTRRPGIAKFLTGYGHAETCSLCKAARMDCDNCVYVNYNSYCNSHVTYFNIYHSRTPEGLLNAYRTRAKYMRKILDKLGYKQPK